MYFRSRGFEKKMNWKFENFQVGPCIGVYGGLKDIATSCVQKITHEPGPPLLGSKGRLLLYISVPMSTRFLAITSEPGN